MLKTLLQVATGNLPADIIYEIMHQFADNFSPSCKDQLASCALVARGWRFHAQQLIHRLIVVDVKTYKTVLSKYCSHERGTPFDGEIWRFPRIVRFFTAPPAGVSSWLQVPEFRIFVDRCGESIAKVDIEFHQFTRLDDALQVICLFPSLKAVSLSDSRDKALPPYSGLQPCERLVPRSLRQVSLTQWNNCCAPTGQCLIRDFAKWLSDAPDNNTRVSLHYVFPFSKSKDSLCNSLDFVAGNIHNLVLEIDEQSLHDDDMDPVRSLLCLSYKSQILRNRALFLLQFDVDDGSNYEGAAFPELSLCTQLEELSFHNYALSIPDYARFTLSSVTSKVLTSIEFMADVENTDDIGQAFFPGLDGLGNLFSRAELFPALRNLNFSIWICAEDQTFAARQDIIRGLLSREFDDLVRARKEVEVESEFQQELPRRQPVRRGQDEDENENEDMVVVMDEDEDDDEDDDVYVDEDEDDDDDVDEDEGEDEGDNEDDDDDMNA